jgi:hypothetical protein
MACLMGSCSILFTLLAVAIVAAVVAAVANRVCCRYGVVVLRIVFTLLYYVVTTGIHNDHMLKCLCNLLRVVS